MSGQQQNIMDLHGKNAVITGASSGIGKVIALTLALLVLVMLLKNSL